MVFGDEEPRPELRDAAVRLEALVGGTEVRPEAGRSLADAARRVLSRIGLEDPSSAREAQARAEAILRDVRADTAADLSPSLDVGLDARMKGAAEALITATLSRRPEDALFAWRRVEAVKQHDRAADNGPRVRRMTMAARLAAWLTVPRPLRPAGFAAVAANYVEDSGFVDRARDAIKPGDPLPEVAAAYSKLREAATVEREAENEAFAKALTSWNQSGAPGDSPPPIERLLDLVIAPLARHAPVLLLILDGLECRYLARLGRVSPSTRLDRNEGFGWTVPELRRRGAADGDRSFASQPAERSAGQGPAIDRAGWLFAAPRAARHISIRAPTGTVS